MHASGKLVAVWIDLSAPKDLYFEGVDFYRRVYDLGVDMLTTDYPKEAHL